MPAFRFAITRGNAMGPLNGVRIIEFAGIGPGPMCGMMLADMGATVLRIDRKIPITHYAGQAWDSYNPGRFGVLNRGKQSVTLNLKMSEGIAAALRLIDGADALIDPFRPGVMEKLGLGPEACLARNPRLVFGRMTGFGQDGPLAQSAGHDLNYIGLSGALHVIGRPGEPPPRRSLISATSAAARACWPSASPARCSRRAARVGAR